ncbi:sensor histidine kinase [Microbacterium rhizophilus]|uniref:sensor histidine kinase n=1 Tax=Microbacterium rhizophilus TaxID=3138934 RepID=UPI0031EF39F0
MPGPARLDSWGEPRDPRGGRWIAFALSLAATLVGGLGRLTWMHEGSGPGWFTVVLGVAAACALLLVDRWPGPGVAATGALAIAALALAPAPPFALVPLAIGIARAVRYGAVWWAAGVTAATLAVPVVTVTLNSRWFMLPAMLTVVVSAIVLGLSIALRGRHERMRRLRASLEERRRTEAERERVRIARELHDVLAHSLSSISVQAGVALHLADREPQRAQDALRDIRRTSTQALDEVRQVLGVLRGDEGAALAPEPDLAALPELIEESRRLGLTVTLDDRLDPRPPATVQLALHRILREALTNAARHAPGAVVRISLRREAGAAVAEVADGGPTRPVEPPRGGGRGILGMRERAVLLGGTLEAGPRGDGFAVVARIPAGKDEA